VIRRISLGLVLVVGLLWLISTIALGCPGKTAAVDNLTDASDQSSATKA
jgi:hypothetical protein